MHAAVTVIVVTLMLGLYFVGVASFETSLLVLLALIAVDLAYGVAPSDDRRDEQWRE